MKSPLKSCFWVFRDGASCVMSPENNFHEIFIVFFVTWVLTCEWVANLFAREPKNAKKMLFSSFATRKWVAKNSDTCFSTENMFKTMKNKVRTKHEHKEWYKSLPNTYKMIKNLFSLIKHVVKHTYNTFNQVQSNKWIKHSLNIRLVCCVCVSNVE